MTLAQRVVLLLLGLSLLAGLATGTAIYYRLTYFWALLFFGSWLWSFFSLRGLRFKREARTLRAQVGQVFEERFEIVNESRLFRVWLEVRNESPLPDSGGGSMATRHWPQYPLPPQGKSMRMPLCRRKARTGVPGLAWKIISPGFTVTRYMEPRY